MEEKRKEKDGTDQLQAYIGEVLHRVLYPNARMNEFKKKVCAG